MKTAKGGNGAPERKTFGFLLEFETPADLLHACENVRDAGYTKWDAHTPFPVHGLDRAMGLKATALPWLVFQAGAIGTLTAVVIQWWTNAENYKYVISGKPFWSIPANVPVAFELTVLFAAIGAFLGMIILNGLPQWNHPVFTSERFRRATIDRFFLTIESRDPLFDESKTRAFLESLQGTHLERLEA